MTSPIVRMLEKHRQTRWATEDQQLQTARESEKTGGTKKKKRQEEGRRKEVKRDLEKRQWN